MFVVGREVNSWSRHHNINRGDFVRLSLVFHNWIWTQIEWRLISEKCGINWRPDWADFWPDLRILNSWEIMKNCLNWSNPRVRSVKTQLICCELKWRHVSTQGVIIRPVIEPYLKYIKWKCTFVGSQNVYNSERTLVQLRLVFTVLYVIHWLIFTILYIL